MENTDPLPAAPESSTSPTTKEPDLKANVKKETKTDKDVSSPVKSVKLKREKSLDDVASDDSNVQLQSEPDSTHSPTDGKGDMICVVCGDKANGMHYRALTCEGCKTFFRRNARKRDNLKCDMEETGRCEMDLYMRRHCAYCRMKKCLEVGMQVGRLWDKERLKTRKPIKKIKMPNENSADEEPVTESSSPTPQVTKPQAPPLHEMSEEHKQLIASISLAFNETMERVKEIPEKPTMTIEEARKQEEQQDENDFTRALIASMTSMGESLAMAAQSFQQGAGTSMDGSLGARGMPLAEDIPSCSSQMCDPMYSGVIQGTTGLLSDQPNQGTTNAPLEATNAPSEAAASVDNPEEEMKEEGEPFKEAVYKHIMEVCLLLLKQMIAFAKTLPGFLELQCEDQAALVKGSFVEYLVIESGGIFDESHKTFVSTWFPGTTYDFGDASMGGFAGMIKEVEHFVVKMANLQLTEEERAVLYSICILSPGTFVEYLVLTSGGIFDGEQKAFVSDLVPGEMYYLSDTHLAGFGGMFEQMKEFTEKMGKISLREEEKTLLYSVCVLTPDRPELSDAAKQIISANQEVLVEALTSSGRVNHPDQPQFLPKVVNLLTELRNCTESFMDHMMQLKLKGQFIQPILGEVLEM